MNMSYFVQAACSMIDSNRVFHILVFFIFAILLEAPYDVDGTCWYKYSLRRVRKYRIDDLIPVDFYIDTVYRVLYLDIGQF